MTLTEEQIIALAPDESSRKSGKDLASPAKWVTRGGNDSALWGECQGSGSKPYQTQIDLNNIAFKCSCPSRKFPCKHGIGLLLFKARQPANFVDTQMPPWVVDWISKRVNRQEKETEKKDKPVDEAAQAKRQASRELKVGDGLDELLLWIKDIVRNGILNIPEKDSVWFGNMARRMVDAQAPGMAGMLRNLGNISYFREGWQSLFMDQLAGIYLVISGYKNLNNINDTLQQDIRTWIGFTQNQEELKEQTGLTDTWLVLGKQTEEEDNLVVERYWLYGVNSRRYALVLQFVFRGQGAQLTLTPGLFVQAELVYFPSSSPLRALIKRQDATPAAVAVPGFGGWQEVLEQETALTSLQPFRFERPYIVQQLTPIGYKDAWWLQDKEQYIMPVKEGYSNIWKLLSLSGGAPMNMALIGKEQYYEPLGVWYNSEYRPL